MTNTAATISNEQTTQKTNGMAIAAIIFAFVFNIVGIILGHIALSKIKQTGENGRGLAITALIVGYISFVVGVIVMINVVQLMGEVQSSSIY